MDAEKTYDIERCAYCLWAGEPCVACDSLGYVVVEQPARQCSHCGGQGRVGHLRQLWGLRCQACLGTGWQAVMLAYVPVSSVTATNHLETFNSFLKPDNLERTKLAAIAELRKALWCAIQATNENDDSQRAVLTGSASRSFRETINLLSEFPSEILDSDAREMLSKLQRLMERLTPPRP